MRSTRRYYRPAPAPRGTCLRAHVRKGVPGHEYRAISRLRDWLCACRERATPVLAGLNPWLVAIGILEIAAAIHAAYHQNPKMAVINVLYALSSFVLSAVKG